MAPFLFLQSVSAEVKLSAVSAEVNFLQRFVRFLQKFLQWLKLSAEVSPVSAEVSAVSAGSCLQRFISAANFKKKF